MHALRGAGGRARPDARAELHRDRPAARLGRRRGRRGRRAGALDGRRGRAPTSRGSRREFARLARSVDPADPWSHPEAERLDRLSVGAWLRSQGARPGVDPLRRPHAALALDRLGRAHVAARPAAQGGGRRRPRLLRRAPLGAPARGRGLGHGGAAHGRRARRARPARQRRRGASASPRTRCTAFLRDGERIEAEAVVCALPVGPLRDVMVSGVSEARLDSLHRQRSALAAKTVVAYPSSFWDVGGATADGIWSSVWIQRDGVLSSLTPPDRLGPCLATPEPLRRREFLDMLASLMGDEALDPILYGTRALGRRPVHEGLRDRLAPGRRDGGRPAARHARAALLRLRLGPVGRGLHGGRRAHRPRRGLAGARAAGRATTRSRVARRTPSRPRRTPRAAIARE